MKKEIKDKTEETQNAEEKKKSELEEYKEMLQRLQADFENYRKRVEREKTEIRDYAKAELMAKLLPVLDSFELALKNSSDKEKFLKGVELIFAQFHGILSNEGLKPIEAIGKKFDPYQHDALVQKESEQDNIVLEEFQKGYMLNSFILRHAKVMIGKSPKKEVADVNIKEHPGENSN